LILTDTIDKIQYLSPDKIVVDYSSIEGIGVFATTDIRAGTIIERCPMVRMGWRSNYQHDPTVWKYLHFQPKCDCNDCNNHGHIAWMVLGYGMLYNNQETPNAKWSFDYLQAYADVVATQDIIRGDEIFVSYGSSSFNNKTKTESDNTMTNDITNYDLDSDDEFMDKINKLLHSPQTAEPLEDHYEDDETFMTKINELLQKESSKLKTSKTQEQIDEETRLYGTPLP
jgi:hypothetical protein